MDYATFLDRRRRTVKPCGFEATDINSRMFDWQADIVRYACRMGRFGGFENCGLGKTFQQLECAHQIRKQTDGKILILAPLAVAQQTEREAKKFGIETDVTICKSQEDVRPGINVANYERLHLFNPNEFDALILDEGSILKSVDGKIRTKILTEFTGVPFRQSWTATPSPNDYMELGNQSEFLGVMSRAEMLSMFFVHDSGETQKWRLKGHAKSEFWKWMARWSVVLQCPGDLGHSNNGYDLPSLVYHEHVVDAKPAPGMLFSTDATTLNERRAAKKETIKERCRLIADMINGSDEPWVVWCNLNEEGTTLDKMIDDAVEVAGRHSIDVKEDRLTRFIDGDIRVLITKPKIGGFGLNMQHCNNTAIFPTDSFESWYQMIRRFWRFGQTKPVNVHLVCSEREGAVVANLKRKESDAAEMFQSMVEHMRELSAVNVRSVKQEKTDYQPTQVMGVPEWLLSKQMQNA